MEVTEKDYLDVDIPIDGQEYCCISKNKIIKYLILMIMVHIQI